MKKKGKRSKVRVAFRKNREARARRQNLTRDVLDAGAEEIDLAGGERISGKGDVSRHRTVVAVETEDGLVLDVDESACLTGRVVSSVGLVNNVRASDGRTFECSVRRVVRTMARDGRNVVVTGDRVLFRPLEDGTGVIERVEPRGATLSRFSQRREHVIVANVDQVVVVVSAADPPVKPNLVDRFLVSAAKGGSKAVVVVNKADLVDVARLQPLAGVYTRTGHDFEIVSATTGFGIDRLRRRLAGRQSVVAGQSGVGKSSLLNVVQPGLALATGEVAEDSRKGRHTTRSARLLELSGEGFEGANTGWVVDTPGIRQLALWDVEPGEVEAHFVEFRPFVTLCRYPDCSHTHEEGCGVKLATRRGLISPLRYASYVRILEGD